MAVEPRVEILPFAPENCTVLGYRVVETHPRWRGLDFSGAERRTQSTMMLAVIGPDAPTDLHLNVPFAYPGEPKAHYEGVKYRVRPRMEPGKRWKGRKVAAVDIVPAAGVPPWAIEVRYA